MDLNNLLIVDIETIKGFYLFCAVNPATNEKFEFSINQYQNDLYKLIKFLEIHKQYYQIGFNIIGFDGIVNEYIWRNYEKWWDMSSLQISELLWQYAQDVIEDSNYNIQPKFKEETFSFNYIDVPRIFHWFNENKRVSLKQAEFELRAETIQNFDVDHQKIEFSLEEVESLKSYCFNDIKYTYECYRHVIGDTNHPLYKGKNKIVDREIIQNEVGLKCLNWDDVKIGAEWNKKDYLTLTQKKEWDLKPKIVNVFYGKKYKQFFPPTVTFQTEKLNKWVKEIGDQYVTAKKQEFEYTFNPSLTIRIGKGGLHSQETSRMIIPDENEEFLQNDIGSQYPNAMSKYGIYPSHLGKSWNQMLISKIERRLKYKELYKSTKDPKYASLQEMGKLSLNGGAYGRLNTDGDWQQDPCAMLKTTIGCQLEILMIVEGLIEKEFNITSCNTDGWDCIVPKNRLDEYFNIVEYYEKLIGNDKLGNVEYTVFEWMAQLSVNDYIAKKKGVYEKRVFKEDRIVERQSSFPDLKLKGDAVVDSALHMNSSFRIIPLAFVNYFANNIVPEEFINNHNNIFDFCARSNSGGTYTHIGFKRNENFKLPKLIRYYTSKEGVKIKKIVKPEINTGANDVNVRPAECLKTVCNSLPKESWEYHLNNIHREWYIDRVNELIYRVTTGKKPKTKKIDPNQGNLFNL